MYIYMHICTHTYIHIRLNYKFGVSHLSVTLKRALKKSLKKESTFHIVILKKAHNILQQSPYK